MWNAFRPKPTHLDSRCCTYKLVSFTSLETQAVGFQETLTSRGREAQFHDKYSPPQSPLLEILEIRSCAFDRGDMMFLMPLADDGSEERALWEERGDLETNMLDWEAKWICILPYRDK